ncbi:hypothetical protein FJV83_24205 [Mesorhizobium sp. WSM4307]|uniref:hypothetical protein n=1 Tax=unclassified Mesorhizobium TaxID=325217 RepID=UPI00115E65EE|nr:MULTISPECIES: hypothetical protein [unclassified Mesorhizobium]TRC76885.1 hypothetical protein FJV81_14755 [Mesorhizobium sp. WSM4315]TRC81282.1 hypothetical protein FJV83_24205 [Mesorhizobium sp. WSM4307]
MTNHFKRGSIDDFCARRGFCRSTFYNHLATMPTITKVGRRVIILEEDEAAWVEKRREAEPALEAA